jgi:hypothetical protein
MTPWTRQKEGRLLKGFETPDCSALPGSVNLPAGIVWAKAIVVFSNLRLERLSQIVADAVVPVSAAQSATNGGTQAFIAAPSFHRFHLSFFQG